MHVHTIPLNIEKLLGGTIGMDATEFGAYLSLIIACYQSGGRLPKDDKRLARMARVSGHKWNKIKPIILEKFSEKGDFYEQKFVKNSLESMKKLSKKNQANALKNKETEKPVAKPKQSQNQANTSIKNQVSNIINNTPYIIPPFVDEKTFNDFLDMRKKIKAPMTNRAIELLIGKLTSFAEKGYCPNEALERSIINNWKSIYEPKNQTKGNSNGKQSIKDEVARLLEQNR